MTQEKWLLKSISKGFGKLTWHLLLFANFHNKMQRIKIGHLQGNWHLDLANDKNRRSPGARALCSRDWVCKVIHNLAFLPSLLPHLPSCPNCKLQIQNRWIPLLEFFGKLLKHKPQMQNPWRCSNKRERHPTAVEKFPMSSDLRSCLFANFFAKCIL